MTTILFVEMNSNTILIEKTKKKLSELRAYEEFIEVGHFDN